MPAYITPVSGSSNIAGVGYDADTQELAIRFHSGRTYTYANVPVEQYEGLMSAASKGQYFIDNIRDAYAVARG